MLQQIISGGQTGADRAALDFAIEFNIPYGGWIPKGRLAEDGPIPDKYNLQEMPTKSYPKWTELNVLDSDGTVILTHGKLTGGLNLTKALADKHDRPCLLIDLDETLEFSSALKIVNWIFQNYVRDLNVTGSRASKDPYIYNKVYQVLESVRHLDWYRDSIPGIDFACEVKSFRSPEEIEQTADWLDCPFCGMYKIKLEPGERYCPSCGAFFTIDDSCDSVFCDVDNLRMPMAGTVCSNCGLVQGESNKKCMYCGMSLHREGSNYNLIRRGQVKTDLTT